ncbi:MAG: hypothetical protein ACOYD3_04845 [Kiritimatiellia bacterium]|jgi:hypothetical protein
MKKRNYTVAAVGTALAALLLLTGCESTDEVSVSISPSHTRLGVNQSVTLTASGGHTYRWSLGASTGGPNNPATAKTNNQATAKTDNGVLSSTVNGVLSSTVGERVTYRALKSGVTQTVTCYATGPGGQTTAIAPGQATIVQQ